MVSVFFLENGLVLIRSKILVSDPPWLGTKARPGFFCFRTVETPVATAIASAATVAITTSAAILLIFNSFSKRNNRFLGSQRPPKDFFGQPMVTHGSPVTHKIIWAPCVAFWQHINWYLLMWKGLKIRENGNSLKTQRLYTSWRCTIIGYSLCVSRSLPPAAFWWRWADLVGNVWSRCN